MGRRGNRRESQPNGSFDATNWETERTLADAEADAEMKESGEGTSTTCPCGSEEFLLQAFLHVVNGVPKPEPVDVEELTCPNCGREFEAIQGEGGRILRGDFLGYTELED